MEFIHVRNLEQYHPGYKDRQLLWAKIHFSIVQGDPEMELLKKNEIDKWRFIALICLELRAQKPLPNDDTYWEQYFDIKKRPMSLTLLMLHNFLDTVTGSVGMPIDAVPQSRVDKNKSREEGDSVTKAHPQSLESVKTYFLSVGSTASNAEMFFDHFESNGWKISGKTPMKDWQAAARNWIRRGKSMNGAQPQREYKRL